MRTYYLYNGNSYTSKTTSLYWDGPWVFCIVGIMTTDGLTTLGASASTAMVLTRFLRNKSLSFTEGLKPHALAIHLSI